MDGSFQSFERAANVGKKGEKTLFLTGIPVTFRACSLHASMCQRMCLKIAYGATVYISLPFSVMLYVYLFLLHATQVLVYFYRTNLKYFLGKNIIS